MTNIAIIGYEANVSGDIKYGPLRMIKKMSKRLLDTDSEFCFDFAIDKLDNQDIETLVGMTLDSCPDVILYAGYRDNYPEHVYNRPDFDETCIREIQKQSAYRGIHVPILLVTSNPWTSDIAERLGISHATPNSTEVRFYSRNKLPPVEETTPEEKLLLN